MGNLPYHYMDDDVRFKMEIYDRPLLDLYERVRKLQRGFIR